MAILDKLKQPFKMPSRLNFKGFKDISYKAKYWIGASVITLIVVAASGYFLLPQWSTYQNLKTRYETLSLTDADVTQKREWLDDRKQQYADLKEELALSLDEKGVHYTGVVLDHIAKHGHVHISRLVPMAERPFDGYVEVPMQLIIQGTYAEIAQFARNLRDLDHRAEMRDVRIYPVFRPVEGAQLPTDQAAKDGEDENATGVKERSLLFSWSTEGGSGISIDQVGRILFLDDVTTRSDHKMRKVEMECELVFLRSGDDLPVENVDVPGIIGKLDPTNPSLYIEPKVDVSDEGADYSDAAGGTMPHVQDDDATLQGEPLGPPPLPPGYFE